MKPLVFAELSALAYETNQEKLKQKLEDVGYELVRTPSVNESDALVVKTSKYLIVTFRGTEYSNGSIKDLWRNVGCPAEFRDLGYAHSGYFRALSFLIKPLNYIVHKHGWEKKIFLTGHSQGGAMAHLYHLEVERSLLADNFNGTITFGAPKAGDWELFGYLQKPIVRYVNICDLAPHWPPVPFLTQPDDTAYLVNQNDQLGPLIYHDIKNYINALQYVPANTAIFP